MSSSTHCRSNRSRRMCCAVSDPAVDDKLKVVVNDYAGHPFQIQLARKLAEDGHVVEFLYCSTNLTPHGDLLSPAHRLTVTAVSTGSTFAKYAVGKRAWQELRYGFTSALAQRRAAADVILTSNVPVLALLVMRVLNRSTKQVLWLQDIQAGLAGLALTGPKRVLAGLFGRLERLTITSADAVIAIAPSLAAEVVALGVDESHIEVIENWAPLDEMPVRPQENEWARGHGLVDKTVFLYSGSLGIKHRPELLVALSREFSADPSKQIVVVSEGVGAEWLSAQAALHRLDNLLLLPYQPFDVLPEVLATADILIALLEQEVGSFSIPSKVLSYLCAGKPILASLPLTNSSAELIADRAAAGLVSSTESEFVAHARELAECPETRSRLGINGRLHAEMAFDIDLISKRFLSVLRDHNDLPIDGRHPGGTNA